MTSANDRATFAEDADPYRRELLAHCYRMLGSLTEAEDLVQETYLRAWRGYRDFRGEAALRTWLYRIATNACLKALEHGRRKVLPSGLGEPSDDPDAPLGARRQEVSWLRPVPDAWLDPATITESRGTVRLAFVAALQYLPARQRAVLILRDVLAFRAHEVAGLLGSSTAAVNSALQRARSRLAEIAPDPGELSPPGDPRQRELLSLYAKAFENADIDALVRVLTEDAVLEMPPLPVWFAGRATVCRFLSGRLTEAGAVLMVPAAANGQPAFGVYLRGSAHALQVLTVRPAGIARIDMFHDPGLFPAFGLPATVPPAPR